MPFKLNLISLSLFFYFHTISSGTFEIDYPNYRFLKDGQPFQYIAGDLHYARVHHQQWDDRLKRVRGAGLNAVQTYVPWNLHEPTPGRFDFSDGLNITQFLSLAQENGLFVLLRAGPFIGAEWDNGGMPWWLLKYDNIRLRSSDKNFTNAVKNFYDTFLDVIKPFIYQNGGPILMLQIENEYGAMNVCDHTYMDFLRDLFRSKLGQDVVLYTVDSAGIANVNCSKTEGVFPTVDFHPETNNDMIDWHFEVQQEVSRGGPNVCSEYYITWVTEWGQTSPNIQDRTTIIRNFDYFYRVKKASWSVYMIHGGSNFGFHPYSGVTTTSYDYGAPISENGDITPIYHQIRDFISNLTDWGYPPTQVPANNPSKSYGQVTLQRLGSNLPSTLSLLQENCVSSTDPLTFEDIDHPYGYVVYTTSLKVGGVRLEASNLKDFGYVYVNNVYKGMLEWGNYPINIDAKPGDVLRILVENWGRQNYWHGTYPPLERRGLFSNVSLDGALLQNWYQCGINLTKPAIDGLTPRFSDPHPDFGVSQKSTSSPGVFIGQFSVNPIQDTWLDSTGWGKGQLFINGYNIGKYWPTRGPQIAIYVPWPYLQAKNTIVLIELNGAQQNSVNFIDHSLYYWKNQTSCTKILC